MLDTLKFDQFQLNQRKETLTSVDSTERYLIKIQLVQNPRKRLSMDEEFQVIRHLNERGSQTCPTAHELGTIRADFLPNDIHWLCDQIPDQMRYIIQDYVPQSECNLHDIYLAMLEQRSLGVYQGDVKPTNAHFNSKTGLCILIDYDQAMYLTDKQSQMTNDEFLAFCDQQDLDHYGIGNWLRHFKTDNTWFKKSILTNNRLDLAKTTVFMRQATTNSDSGIYHTIQAQDVFVVGSRELGPRSQLLDTAQFHAGERVLDVGCNAGLLSEYLHSRGCTVTGVDNDPHIVVAAQVLANIQGKHIAYSHLDLDNVDGISKFDTIMLFSVLHHTRDPVKNGRKIASACERIIIETRLVENGKQPVKGKWVPTSGWSFSELNELVATLEQLFPGFRLYKNLGCADKGRYILEFVKSCI